MAGPAKSAPAGTHSAATATHSADASATPHIDHLATPGKPDLTGWWGEDVSYLLYLAVLSILQITGLSVLAYIYG